MNTPTTTTGVNKQTNKTRAFTLLEMLLVIAIIAILAGIVIIAINPGRQLASARNAQRASDLRALHSAVQQYYIDNHVYPDKLNGNLQEICATAGETGCVDLTDALVPTYIPAIPTDPQALGTSTLYQIAINPTTQAPELTAPNSTEYNMVPVQLGTTTLVQTGGAVVPCGDPTDASCWSDEVTGKAWATVFVDTPADSLTLGADNTAELVALDGSYPAAEYCNTLIEDGFEDWYLPAKDQLLEGYNANPGTFTSDGYWSSTEDSDLPEINAWDLYTDYGDMDGSSKDYADSVRCLR